MNGRDQQGDDQSPNERPQTSLVSRLSARLHTASEGVQPRLPTRLKGDGGSVRASLARKLVGAKLFGRGSGTKSGPARSFATSAGHGSISVRASQRVVVKAFVARHTGRSGVANPAKAIAQHVRYLAREGAGHDGSDAHFYGSEGELNIETVRETTGAWAEDRHHFRLIISPEQADKMDDMEGYVRDVMADVAKDLKEQALNWVGVNHYDTDQPHAHVLIRGVRGKGTTLVMSREIISHGIRHRAEAQAQARLGDITRSYAERNLFARTKANYWTDIDHKLTNMAAANDGILQGSELNRTDTFGAIARGRINHLERLGLITRTREAVTFAPDIKQRLQNLAQSRDEIRSYWDYGRTLMFSQREGISGRKHQSHNQTANREIETTIKLDVTADRLTKYDLILAQRANRAIGSERFQAETEDLLKARAAHLIKTSQGRMQGDGIAFNAQSWTNLRNKEIQAAVREQLGIQRGHVGFQHTASEGRVLGHIDTSLGKHAVVDRGANIVAVPEIAGTELVVGQVLGTSLGR